jgi:phage-related protein
MKPIVFLGKSLATIRGFPDAVRREAGYQLDRLQHGLGPTDWKPMPSIGKGVKEIRIQAAGQYRVIYLASLPEQITVLHAFHKKTRRTRKFDVDQAKVALKAIRTRNES